MTGALWGHSAWGTDKWGIDLSLTGLSALAVTDHSVLVHLDNPPLQRSEIGDGDALNPLTWQVTSAGAPLIVMAVAQVSSQEFEVVTFRALDPYLLDVTVGSATLRNLMGDVLPAFVVMIPGVHQVPAARGPNAIYVDVANPPFLEGQPNARLLVTAAGDYQNETGADLLRKLVFRLLTTQPGEFFDAVDFGIGLAVKEPLSSPSLAQLRLDIERAVAQLPNVVQVGARLTQSLSTLTIELRVQTASEVLVESLPVPVGAGTLF